jgi:hypothetical protein
MKKQLNVDQIQSELRGGSAFFPGYKGWTSPTPPVAEPREENITPESEAVPNDADQEAYSQITRNWETLEHSWSPALSHQ